VYSRYARPKWWQLYLALPILIGLFTLENRLKVSVRGHQAVQIGILLLVYGLVHLWLNANAVTLSDHRQTRGTVTLISIHPYKLANTIPTQKPMFRLPGPEIKGTLGDTYEMEIIDAEFLPVDEISQEMKKE
jgi:hypothetical protein